MQIFANGKQRFLVLFFHGVLCDTPEKNVIRLKKTRSTHQYSTMFFLVNMHYTLRWLSRLVTKSFVFECQLWHLTTLQVTSSRVLWKLKFLLSPSRSLQRKSYNCNTLLRKRDWITTKQNSLFHLFKPYQTWMKSHTSTHCGPIFAFAKPCCCCQSQNEQCSHGQPGLKHQREMHPGTVLFIMDAASERSLILMAHTQSTYM